MFVWLQELTTLLLPFSLSETTELECVTKCLFACSVSTWCVFYFDTFSIPCFPMACLVKVTRQINANFSLHKRLISGLLEKKGTDRFSSPFSELSGSETRAASTLNISYNDTHTLHSFLNALSLSWLTKSYFRPSLRELGWNRSFKKKTHCWTFPSSGSVSQFFH